MQLRTRLLSAAVCLASGLSFGLAFPPLRWHALAWVSLAPMFVAIRLGSTRWAIALLWLWSVTAAWSLGEWFPGSVATYFHQPMPVAVAIFFGVATVMVAPYYVIGGLAYRALARRFSLALPVLAACAWVMAEFARGRLFTGSAFFIGNPWGLLAYSHADVPPLAQVASITGVYGLTFMIASTNSALAELALGWRKPRRRRAATVALLLSPIPAVCAWAFGTHTLETARVGKLDDAVVIAVAQGNLDIGSRWRADSYGRNLGTYLSLTQAAAEREEPRLVVWPESAMTFFLEREEIYRRSIAGVLNRHDLQLLAGGPRQVGSGADEYTNSVYVIESEGALSARYDKEYLVPFAEYFPFQIDILRRKFGRIRNFEAGAETRPLPTRAGLAGILVCNEAMLPEAARKRVAAGAELLINPSNDSWIPDPTYTELQLDIARMRAIELRRWLIRASTAGPSAIVDPWGRTTAVTDSGIRAVAVGEVWPRQDFTIYARLGDWFGFLCVGIVGAAWWRSRRVPGAG